MISTKKNTVARNAFNPNWSFSLPEPLSVPPQLTGDFCRIGHHERFPWNPLPWKGVHNKVLYCNPVTGETIELAKLEKDAIFPQHHHTSVQTLFLISGRLRTEDNQVIEPGTFNVIPAGQIHGPFFADEESIQYKYFSSVPVYILNDGCTFIYRYDGSIIVQPANATHDAADLQRKCATDETTDAFSRVLDEATSYARETFLNHLLAFKNSFRNTDSDPNGSNKTTGNPLERCVRCPGRT